MVAIVFLVSTAYADPAVQALAKKNVVGLGNLADDPELGLADTAVVIDQMGQRIDLASEDGCVTGAVANDFYGCNQASHEHKPISVDVGADTAAGVGWFQVPFTVISTFDNFDTGKEEKSKSAMRTSGIAIREGKSWKIVAQLYALLVTDKELLAGTGGKPASGAPKLSGDQGLAKAVAGWFTTGFAPAAATKGNLIASGTSEKEHKTGAAATKLVASFDKLKLGATTIDAKLFAGGKIGWAIVDVMMPRKNGKGAVEMNLAVIAVPEGGTWKWVSVQYQFPWNPVGR